jgi:hypothetical protein
MRAPMSKPGKVSLAYRGYCLPDPRLWNRKKIAGVGPGQPGVLEPPPIDDVRCLPSRVLPKARTPPRSPSQNLDLGGVLHF